MPRLNAVAPKADRFPLTERGNFYIRLAVRRAPCGATDGVWISGTLAQLVEQQTFNLFVDSSILSCLMRPRRLEA